MRKRFAGQFRKKRLEMGVSKRVERNSVGSRWGERVLSPGDEVNEPWCAVGWGTAQGTERGNHAVSNSVPSFVSKLSCWWGMSTVDWTKPCARPCLLLCRLLRNLLYGVFRLLRPRSPYCTVNTTVTTTGVIEGGVTGDRRVCCGKGVPAAFAGPTLHPKARRTPYTIVNFIRVQ